MTSSDNPIRLLRLRRGLSQAELARRTGLYRASLVSIERGEVREPAPQTLAALSEHLHASPTQLQQSLSTWLARQAPVFDAAQRAKLAQSGSTIARVYPSFRGWRRDLGLSQVALAMAMRISRGGVTDYEAGKRRGMSASMQSGLLRLGLPMDAMLTLSDLPPNAGEPVR